MNETNINQYKTKWNSWLKNEKRLSNNTVKAYQRDLNGFIFFLRDYLNKNINLEVIKDLNERTIRSWFFFKLKRESLPRSNARRLSAIKSFLLYLKKTEVIKTSKILSIKSPKYKTSLPRPLTVNQVEKIISLIKNNKKEWIAKRNLSIVFLMWGFGLRISEVLSIKLKDIQSEDLISIIGKGGKERLIPIYEEIKKNLHEMTSLTPFNIGKDDHIFVGIKGNKLHPTIIQKEIRKIRQELMLPDNTTPHSLRHSFATLLLDNMVDLRSIQELLGHTSLSTTQKYTSVDSNRMKEIINDFHPRSSQKL